jgi:hypothetical protein
VKTLFLLWKISMQVPALFGEALWKAWVLEVGLPSRGISETEEP